MPYFRRSVWLPGLAACIGALAVAQASAAPLIERVFTDAARHPPDASATIHVALENTTGAAWSGVVRLRIWNDTALAYVAEQSASIAPGATDEVSFAWTPPPIDFRGYFVEVDAGGLDSATTAIDVSSDWTRYPRYGYLTEMYSGQSTAYSTGLVQQLAEDYHINGLQFYDWMWRHEQVIDYSRPGVIKDPWVDWRGAAISFSVLQDLITASHSQNVAALPYFMIYGAQDDYDTISGVSPEWGIYADATHAQQHNHDGWLYFFDPTNTNWRQHLLAEIADAINVVGFDGVHFDQIGYRDPIYDYWGDSVNLANGGGFRNMIDAALAELQTIAAQTPPVLEDYALTFNMVDGGINAWGVPAVVSNASHDFLYSEIWSLDSYLEMVDFVRWARANANQKAMVLAAYLNHDESFSTFNEPSVRLADAAFAVAGTYHIELGDGRHMLGDPFFPNRDKTPTASLLAAMREYYDFLTAHERGLFDPALVYADSGGQWIDVQGVPWSTAPEANKLWVSPRRLDDHDVMHLVNLSGNDDEWRNAASPATTLPDVQITYRIGPHATIDRVVAASPDVNDGRPTELAFTSGSDAIGSFVRFDVPLIEYWTCVQLHRDAAAPPNGRYEAEDAIKTGVAVDTDHSGYSGSGFVDQFDSSSDGVSFYVHAPVDGWYDLGLRYANATGGTATRRVTVDGVQVGFASLPNQANWDVWATATLPVQLKAGARQVNIGYGGVGAINLDYIELPALGPGLLGAYHDSTHFANRAKVRLDATVDFDWGAGAPASGVDPNAFTVRWSGTATPPTSGAYTFTTHSAGAVRLFVDDQLVVDHWAEHAAGDDAGQCDLTAGVPVDVVLVYRETADQSKIRLSWAGPGESSVIIPSAALLPAFDPADRQAPTAPDQLQAIDVDPNAVTLAWQPSIDDYAMGVYCVMIDGQFAEQTSATQYRLTALSPGATHTFTVQAVDIFGNVSAESDALVVTTPQVLFGDGDRDGDVDVDDAAMLLELCWTGPHPAPGAALPTCLDAFDSDGDGDVDLHDHAAFLAVFPHD